MFKSLMEYTLSEEVCDSALLKDVQEITCSNGKKAYFLTCSTKSGDFNAKVWDVSIVNGDISALKGNVVSLTGSVREYKGVREISVTALSKSDEPVTNYLPCADIDSLSPKFNSILRNNLSDNAYGVLSLLFNGVDGLFNTFITATAALSYHDNIVGGLLNHTCKMLSLLETLVSNDKRLQGYKDILFLGVALHDIGKVYEYTPTIGLGKYHYVDHKAFGIELLAQHKADIVNLIGEKSYYDLLAIILGHHDEFGEPAHTVCAEIVHQLDMLDSVVTNMMQSIDKAGSATEIKYNGKYLAI